MCILYLSFCGVESFVSLVSLAPILSASVGIFAYIVRFLSDELDVGSGVSSTAVCSNADIVYQL